MISIVIPLFNKAHSIERTLKSIFAQTYTKFEIIIINDGSTDNGIEVITKFTTDPRVKIITQENQGVSAARNMGVLSSKYTYIAFLDGDDEWLPEYLTKMVQAIEMFPSAGMFCCAGIVRNADGTKNIRIANKYKNQILEINFFENPHVFLHTSATIVSKKQFNHTAGFPVGMKRNQDFALFFSLALITQVIYCGIPLSIYVGGIEGQTTSVSMNGNIFILQHVVNRYNIVNTVWENTPFKNKYYKLFLKYELRHTIITQLRESDFKSIHFLFENLDKKITKLFTGVEIYIYREPKLKWIGIVFILATKLRWRLRGFPIVGK